MRSSILRRNWTTSSWISWTDFWCAFSNFGSFASRSMRKVATRAVR